MHNLVLLELELELHQSATAKGKQFLTHAIVELHLQALLWQML